MLPLISLEDHFLATSVVDSSSSSKIPFNMYPSSVFENLIDLDERRLANMDRGNTVVQVVSHLQSVEPLQVCREANNQLAEAVKRNKGRLNGFAILPMGEPAAIPDELDRCVKTLGFLGALIPNHTNGSYYDDQAYWPMFERAQELDVPLYLHPAPPVDLKFAEGNYSQDVAKLLSGPALGWHTDVAFHVIRLYACGLFDRYPSLKIIIGHMGETLPFMVERINRMLSRRWGSKDRGFLTVWRENFWITTSGMFELGPFACLLRTVSPDRILYSMYIAHVASGFTNISPKA